MQPQLYQEDVQQGLRREAEMASKLCLLICENYRLETMKLLAAGEFADVTAAFFPARCGRPVLTTDELVALSGGGFDPRDVLVCGSCCLPQSAESAAEPPSFRTLRQEHCMAVLAGSTLLAAQLARGAYIATPGWLARWRYWVDQWGGDITFARQMMSETVSRIVLLDTGVDPESGKWLKELSDYLARPAEVLEVGLDYFRRFLSCEIYKWRDERGSGPVVSGAGDKVKRLADYAMAMDLLSELPRSEKEEVLADRMIDLFCQVFAPEVVTILSRRTGEPYRIWSLSPYADEPALMIRLGHFRQAVSTTASGRGFLFCIGSPEHALAVVELDGLAHPEYL